MLSHSQVSAVTVEEHSIRQPWVEMSISRTRTLLRLPSRIVAARRRATRFGAPALGLVGRLLDGFGHAHLSPRPLVGAEDEQMVVG